jgi:hypothetical protein
MSLERVFSLGRVQIKSIFLKHTKKGGKREQQQQQLHVMLFFYELLRV